MINYHTDLVAILNTILPTHYEMQLTSATKTPCISYMELSNIAEEEGDTVGYSRLQYQIKVWDNDIAIIQKYALEIDKALRPLGWKRISAGELYDNQSTMIQKIMTYEAKASETF